MEYIPIQWIELAEAVIKQWYKDTERSAYKDDFNSLNECLRSVPGIDMYNYSNIDMKELYLKAYEKGVEKRNAKKNKTNR